MRECPKCGNCAEDSLLVCPSDGNSMTLSIPGPCTLDGKYLIVKRLGRGGMGSVYLSMHIALNRRFAIKLVTPSCSGNKSYQSYFRTEAQALGRLRNSNIVGVTDFGVDSREDGLPYLVMDFLEGMSLAEFLLQNGPLTPTSALAILEQIANAVDYAHKQGVLHRDLKPANIYLANDLSGNPVVKVLDFGLARLFENPDSLELAPEVENSECPQKNAGSPDHHERLDLESGVTDPHQSDFSEALTIPMAFGNSEVETVAAAQNPNDLVGTPGYMAPEIVSQKRAGTSVDTYSFGMMAYEMVAGRLPFEGPASAVMSLHVRTPPPPPSRFNAEIPGTMDAAFLAPLAINPNDRPSSLRAAVDGIRRTIDSQAYQKWCEREVPRRLKMTVVIALLGIVLSAILPLFNAVAAIEYRLEDARISLMRPRAPDPRILLIGLDEATLDDGAANFFQRADRFVQGVDGVFKAGASGIAIDLILPRRFSESESLSKVILNHRKNLVVALFASSGGQLRGWECLSELTRSMYSSNSELAAQFGIVNFEPDSDGRIRRFQTRIRSENGLYLEPIAVHLHRWMTSSPMKTGLARIDFSVDQTTLSRLPWSELNRQLVENPSMFKDRYVIIGSDTAGHEDLRLIPSIRGRTNQISGPELHAILLQTLLDGEPIRSIPTYLWLWIFLALLGVSVWSLLRTPRQLYAWCIVVATLFAGLGFGVYLGLQGLMIPLAAPGIAFLTIVVSASIGRRLLSPIPKTPTDLGVASAY